MTITELCFIHLAPEYRNGKYPKDVHDKLAGIVRSQPGCEGVYRGFTVEGDGEYLAWLINWTHLEDHQKFIDSEAYGPFTQEIFAYTASKSPQSIDLKHYAFPTDVILGAVHSPVVEFFSFRIGSSHSVPTKEVLSRISVFASVLAKNSGFPATFAQAHEDEKDVVAAIAWETVQQHLDARKEDWHKEGGKVFRSGDWIQEGSGKVVHVAFEEFKA